VSVRFQLSLHAIIIQPHCEPHPQATCLLALLLEQMEKTDIDKLYGLRYLRSVIFFSFRYPNGHRPSSAQQEAPSPFRDGAREA
jgi:hypothetical protein